MRKFIVYGEPTGKGRPIVTRSGHAFTPKKTVSYENNVKQSYMNTYDFCMPYEKGVPLKVELTAYFSIPTSISKKKRQRMIDQQELPCKKPDGDNICKSILDSLNGLAYHDDSQVVELTIHKLYGIQPRVEVVIEEINTIVGEKVDGM